MNNKRSKGVMIIGSLNTMFFGAGLLLLSGIFGTAFKYIEFSNKGIPLGSYQIFLVVQQIVFSICYIISGNGILHLKEWARSITLKISWCSLIMHIYFFINNFSVFIDSFPHVKPNEVIYISLNPLIGGIIYPGILLYFFTRQTVKEQFKT